MDSESEHDSSSAGSSSCDCEECSELDTSSDSDSFELCCVPGGSCSKNGKCPKDGPLPFDVGGIEKIILALIDKFNFRVVMNNERVKKAMLVTSGLSLAGSVIGKHYGGNIGMAVGGAVGGACGLGFAVISMRDIWNDIKFKLSELFEVVYDFLAGLGIQDYKQAAKFLTTSTSGADLATVLLSIASDILGKKVISTLSQ